MLYQTLGLFDAMGTMKTENNMKNYGSLIDYLTGVYIRPATEQEWRASCEAEAGNVGGGSGVIKVNGESVFVSGGPKYVNHEHLTNA